MGIPGRKGRWLAVAVSVATLTNGCGSSGDVATSSDQRQSPNWQLPATGFVKLPASPNGAVGQTLALDDGRFLSHGAPAGGSPWPRFDGQVFDPTTGAWTVLPDEPFGPLAVPSVIATRSGFVVLGVSCDREKPGGDTEILCDPGTFDGARYDLDTETWESLGIPDAAVPPADASGAAFAVRVAVPEEYLYVRLGERSYRLDPGSMRWTEVENMKVSGATCGTSGGVVHVRTAPGTGMPQVPGSGGPTGSTADFRAFVLGPDGSWNEVANTSAEARPSTASNVVVCTGGSVLVVGTGGDETNPYLFRYRTEEGWTDLGTPPADLGHPQSTPVESGAVIVGSSSYVYSDATANWERSATDLASASIPVVSDEGIFVGTELVPVEVSEDPAPSLQPVASAARVFG